MPIFRYAQFSGTDKIKVRIVFKNGKKSLEVIAGSLGPEMCEKARKFLEAQMGLSQEQVLTESKHSQVEEKMLAPLEEEQQSAPMQEKQQQKY